MSVGKTEKRGTGQLGGSLLCLAALFSGPVIAGCALESTSQLALELTLGDCTDSDFSDVSILSVEVYGANSDGSECALARRCIQVDAPASLEDLRSAVSSVPQPLVDVDDASDVLLVVVTGHSTNDCFDFADRSVCGFADVRDSQDGALSIRLNCSACPTREYPLCQ